MPGENRDGQVKRDRAGKFGGRKNLTTKQVAFVDLAANGVVPTHAARAAGYSAPEAQASRLIRLPAVRAKMFELRQKRIEQGAAVAVGVLIELATDKSGRTPANVRKDAAIWLAETAGHGPKGKHDGQTDSRDLREMSIAELEAIVSKRLSDTPKAPGTIDIVPTGTTAGDPMPVEPASALASEDSEAQPAGEADTPADLEPGLDAG